MNTFLRFFYEFISIFFDGFFSGLKGLWDGITKMFSFAEYAKVISSYRESFNGQERIFAILGIAFIILIPSLTVLIAKLESTTKPFLIPLDLNETEDKTLVLSFKNSLTKILTESDPISTLVNIFFMLSTLPKMIQSNYTRNFTQNQQNITIFYIHI